MRSLVERVAIPTLCLSGEPSKWPGALPEQVALPHMDEVEVVAGSLPSLGKALEGVREHRRPRGFRAEQPPVLLVPSLLFLLVAEMCGRRGYGSKAEWGVVCGQEHPEVLDALGFPQDRQPRTPAAATLFRLVRDLDLEGFQAAVQGWLAGVAKALQVTLPEWEKRKVPADQIALDGKTVRGAAARREREKGGLHVVAAYVPALRTVLAQLATGGKGEELAAVGLLLGRLELRGRVVTADALCTQRSVCKQVLAEGGDYLLPVKENQPTLLSDIEAAFSPSAHSGGGGGGETGGGGGRAGAAAEASRRQSDGGAGAGQESPSRAV